MIRRFYTVVSLAWLASLALANARPLATLTLEITGQGMAVTPAALSVPKGIPGSVGVAIRGQIPTGAFVEAYLRGPSFPARRLVGAPDKPLMLPPLNLVGDYSLDGHYCNAAAAATALCRGGRTRTRRSARSGRRASRRESGTARDPCTAA